MRIGQGYDAHRFADDKGRVEIRLGGVSIEHNRSIVAHSDGDVVIHALVDALLGALALGDIGQHFPDNNPEYQDVDSRTLLRASYAKITDAGYKLGNADITIIAEKPKVADHIDAMRHALGADMNADPEQVSVKATTTEQMGFTGREEGIAAQAVVLLVRVDP